MRIIITGATGFIGNYLSKLLLEQNYEIVVLTRNASKARKNFGSMVKCVEWDAKTNNGWQAYAEGAYAIINLAGAGIADNLWTESYKKQILESRVNATKAVVMAIEAANEKPKVLLQGSATGIYASRSDELLDESSAKGDSFLADVVDEWEAAAKSVEKMGVRVCYLRTGVVLGKDEGILKKLSLPFKLFVGGTPGSGKQWFSWIHIEDEVNIIFHLLKNDGAEGVYNLVSPDPLRMADFCQQMGSVINRPSWIPVPAFMLKLVMGQMAEETALVSQRILPRRLMENGFRFSYPSLKPALQDLLD